MELDDYIYPYERSREDDTILSNRYFSDKDLKGLYSNRPIGQRQTCFKRRSRKDRAKIIKEFYEATQDLTSPRHGPL